MIMQKLYNKIHLNAVPALILFFQYIVYSGVVTSHEILFSSINKSSLPHVKDTIATLKIKILLVPVI